MKTLIIHDNLGVIFSQITGDYQLPQGGIQYLEIEIPEGKRVVNVDVSLTPHMVIMEDIPPTETQLLNERLEATEQALLQIMLEGML